MQTTSGSTSLDDQQRARRLPPDLLARTNAALDELVILRAQAERQHAASAANSLVAGKARVDRIHVAILAMCEQHAPQLRVWSGSAASMALFVRNQIKWAIKKDGSWHTLTKSPSVRTIAKYIKTLQM